MNDFLANRNLSCECVRPMNNRSGTLPKEQKKDCIVSSHIIECFVLYSFLYNLNQFQSVFKLFKPLDKQIFQLFQII